MKRHTPSPAIIRDAVCAAFDVAPEMMLSNLREDRVAIPRQAYAYLLRTQGALSPLEIQPLIPYCRAQVFKSINTVTKMMRTNDEFHSKIRHAELLILQS